MWIKVEDRLPEKENHGVSKWVLITDSLNKYHCYRARYNLGVWEVWGGVTNIYPIENVTHWQPLPSPPEDV